ncbi:proteasome regulatory particle base subunit rpn10 [Mucor velutinosus]|uniref:Proteasome regulatory particle base subunit rpn10 n=1 Tax=Mucor velutinosus TaxID=708070 RepID=A0AAN7DCV4_9FUNG|nr:proteasome regulatory particle base subunit rpn10 [Mucor velutinosus]
MKDNTIPLELNTGQGANRFKYQTFKTRVERIKVDVVRRSKVVDDEPDEHGSFFYEALMEWKDLNMTRNFKDFAKEMTPLVKSLPSIIYHKDDIVNILEKHLKVKDSLALDGLLDLVTKLAKDLEGEFYPYYPRMLASVLPLVYHQDIKLLESVFNCIAYLFKFLSRQILPDLDQTFLLLAKLLGEDNQAKPYVRHFTAEAFAFLLRKARGADLTKIITCILDTLRADPSLEFEEGLAMLFFESIKQIDHRIHSRGEAIYKELLIQSYKEDVTANDLSDSPIHSLLTKTTLLVLHHTYRQHFTPIIHIVLNELEKHTKNMDEKTLSINVSLLTMIVTVRKGSRVEDFKPIIARIQELTKLIFSSNINTYSNYLYTQLLRSIIGTLNHGSLEVAVSGGRVILDTLNSFQDIELIYGFYLSLAKLGWSNYTQICLPYIIKYSSAHFDTHPYETILFLSEVLSTDALNLNSGSLSSSLTPEGLLRFPNAAKGKKSMVEGILDILSKEYDWEKERDTLNATDMKSEESNMSAITILASALRILPRIQVSVDKVFTVSMSLFMSLSDFLKKHADDNALVETPFVLAHNNYVLESLMGLVLESLAGIAANNTAVFNEMKNIHSKLVDEILRDHARNEVVLSGIYRYLDLLYSGNADQDKFSLQQLERIYPVLKLNFSSYRRNCRLNTLKIIVLFDQPMMKTDQDHKIAEVSEIARIALNMEEVDATFKEYRDKVVLIQKLNLITSNKRTPDLYVDFAPRLSLGVLTVNLRPLWEEAKRLLITFSQVNAEMYWDLVYGEIVKYDDEKSLVWDGFARDVLIKLNTPDEPNNGHATKTGKISFECPTLNTFVHVEDRSWRIMKAEKAQSLALLFAELSQQEPGHMDFWNYYSMLLMTLKETPTITEARGRNLVVLFFHFLDTEFTSAPEDEDGDEEEVDQDKEDQHATGHFDILPKNSRITKTKMANWLSLFAVFKNTKAVYKTHELNAAFMRIIAMGDAKLQLAAMECIFTWKDPNIKPYADNLRNLVDDIKFRDELATFIQNEEQILIDPAHRQGLMPVVMRVLYGRLIQRSKASNKSNKSARRKVILGGISCCKPEEIRIFIDLALEPFQPILALPGMDTDDEGHVTAFKFDPEGYHLMEHIAWRKQTGLLNLMEDTIKQFATHILPFLPDLLKVVLYIINFAHSRRSQSHPEEDAMDVDQADAGKVSDQSTKSKEIKALALKRIVDMFKINGDFNFTPFVPSMFSAFISARLPTLPSDASQDLSTLINLFLVWSKKSTYAPFLVDYDARVLPQVIATLSVKSLNEHVLNVLLEILESLLNLCDEEMDVDGEASLKEKLVIPHVDLILNDLKFRLTQSKDDTKFGSGRYSVREISIAARVAPYTKNGEQAATIIELLLPSLKKPSRTIPEKSKQDIFTIWAKFIRIVPGFEAGSTLYHHYYVMASSMFATAYSRESRVGLLDVFHAFADVNPELAKVDELLTMLNAYSQKRIDQPDYDSMLDALSAIAETYYDQFNVHQWLPVLHQLTHCMHDAEEMAIRGTATHCMAQYLKATAEQADQEEKRKMLGYVNHVIYPAIKRGLRSRVELVRMEFVSLLCSCIKTFPELPIFEDMVPLLGDGDEEVNFFNNVYHMQIHRRARALLRLSEFADEGKLKVATINNIFIPIISAFFKESDRTMDHNLLHQCTLTLSSLAKVLPWNHYYRLLQSYLSLIKENDEKERLFVRVVIGILDAFHFDLQHIELSDDTVKKIMGRQKVRIDYLTNEEIMKQAAKDAGEETKEDAEEAEEAEEEEEAEVSAEAEAKDKNEKIHDVLVAKVMPELNNLLNNNKSRKSVIVRVPLALGIAKLLCNLPEKSKRINLPGLLTSVCHIIRSRAQDVRDITRETLIKISAFLGSSYFNYIVKELRGALKKGYELHVLGYTVNALLLDMMPRLKVGDLDYCLSDLVDVLVSDIFGATGQEKDTDEMTGKIKEAKSRRSPTSFEMIAKITHFKNVGLLLVPLKDIMSHTESSRTLRKVEDLLRRIALGLVNNPEFESLALLDFAYNLISENLEDFKAQPKTKVKKTQKELNFEVQMKRVMVEPVDYYRANAYRFVYFGLSLLSSAVKRIKFDLSNDEYVSRLRKLVNAVGNTLYASQSANVVLAARIMCHLIPMKIPNIQSAVAVSIERSFALIKSSGGSQTTTVQACLRLLTVCIRDNDKSSLTEAQLTYILNFVRPDMEELERQGTIFALVRAIISRKFMAPEMYELMDSVSHVMVTNQSREIREQARSVFFMFLMDYPQGKGRLKQQMSFIIKNLEYVYESGRESIMELLHHIISKFGDDILADYIDPIFFALVMRLINDESSKCREMAAALIKELLARSTERLPTIYKLLNKWLDQSSKPNLQRAACQVYGLAIDTFETQLRPQAAGLVQRLATILESSRQRAETLAQEAAVVDDEEQGESMDIDMQWEVAYYAINTFAKITKTFPRIVYDQETESVWRGMQYMLLYPHAWIRSSSARLYGVYFSGIDAQSRMIKDTTTQCRYLDRETLRVLATDFLEQLKSNHITQDQADQIVKNLFFIGKCFYYMPDEEDVDNGEEEEEEVKIDDARDEVIDEEKGSKAAQDALTKIAQTAHKKSLNWLFRKASFDARGAAIRKIKSAIILRSSIFKWFAAMCNTMTTEEIPPYLMPVVAPIYRTVNDEQNKAAGFEALQQLGNEILNLLQNKAGPTVYFAVYQRVRQQVIKSREDRKSKDAILAISNPALAAKRKLDKHQRSQNKKKRTRL